MTKKKFTYGFDTKDYMDEALRRLKVNHSWVTFEDFHKNWKFAVEKEGRKHVFVQYYCYDDGRISREIYDSDGEDFVKHIVWMNQDYIEWNNEVTETFRVETPRGIEDCGWYLERYEIRKHKRGGVSALIEAGNRSSGGSKTYFLPGNFFEGTFKDFLEKYNDLLPGRYNIDDELLKMNPGLKKFLGFKK